MSASLFAEYPPKPAKQRVRGVARPDLPCCDAWATFERVHGPVDRVCRLVHKLGHSRTAFTLAKVAELTGCSLYGARLTVEDAQRRRWVYCAGKGFGQHDPDLYLGML